jgi:hypothetical protein
MMQKANLFYRTGRFSTRAGKATFFKRMKQKPADVSEEDDGPAGSLEFLSDGLEEVTRAVLPGGEATEAVSTAIEDYERIAGLIVRNPPPWLAEILMSWAPWVLFDALADRLRPSRADMRKRLIAVQKASLRIVQSLQHEERWFLQADPRGPMTYRSALLSCLRDLAGRAERASNLSVLVGEAGITKPGAGQALPPGGASAQVYCAALVAEAWSYFNGKDPAAANKRAQDATDALWVASRAQSVLRLNKRRGRSETHEPGARWRHHLSKVNSSSLSEIRAQFRYDLSQAHARAGSQAGLESAGK